MRARISEKKGKSGKRKTQQRHRIGLKPPSRSATISPCDLYAPLKFKYCSKDNLFSDFLKDLELAFDRSCL